MRSDEAGPFRVARQGVLPYTQTWGECVTAPEISGYVVTQDPPPESTRGRHGSGPSELMKEGAF